MQIHVDQVTDVKTGQYGVSSKIVAGNEHYFVNDDATQHIGKTLEIEVSEKTSKAGNKYKIAKILKVVEASAAAPSTNGHIPWLAYEQMARIAHGLAQTLEPDVTQPSNIAPQGGEDPVETYTVVNRSAARVALVNTVMIAFSNGKISLPEADDEMPF